MNLLKRLFYRLFYHTHIGKHVNIKHGVRFGDDGFGFEKSENGYSEPLTRREHSFNIIIHDHVDIGANSIVHRGRWRNTVINEDTKIDSLVHVAHNVVIGRHCIIVAGTVLGASSELGNRCFIGENVSIKQGIKIVHNVTIGMGSVVRHDITQPNSTWAGNPCVKIADVQKF